MNEAFCHLQARMPSTSFSRWQYLFPRGARSCFVKKYSPAGQLCKVENKPLLGELLGSGLAKHLPALRIDKSAAKKHEGRVAVNSRPDLKLLIDNKGAFEPSHCSGPSKGSKHLGFRDHYIQQQIHNRVVTMDQVLTSEQWAESLTKPVGCILFKQAMVSIDFLAYRTRVVLHHPTNTSQWR